MFSDELEDEKDQIKQATKEKEKSSRKSTKNPKRKTYWAKGTGYASFADNVYPSSSWNHAEILKRQLHRPVGQAVLTAGKLRHHP